MTDDLNHLFSGDDKGSIRMFTMLRDPNVTQICINRHDRIMYWDQGVQRVVNDQVFQGPTQYVAWLDQLLSYTNSEYHSVVGARVSVIEASFKAEVTDVHGSIHIVTSEVTRGEPALTIRKQPRSFVKLDDMLRQGMMNNEMRLFLQQAVHGRLNIILSGGSGAGKTTLARAFSDYIDPANRIVTVEEIDELHLDEKLPNVVSLTTYRNRDDEGRLVRETSLDDLVREALRMRADRIWVGETRGREAYALAKACNSGHDGSITTVHADNGPQAVRQLVTYVMESGVTEQVAREQVSRAFHLVIQVTKEKMGRRVIREITELEPVLEGTQQRSSTLFSYDSTRETFNTVGRPSRRIIESLARYGVNYEDYVTSRS
jgi:pilus assembly protein CpaF